MTIERQADSGLDLTQISVFQAASLVTPPTAPLFYILSGLDHPDVNCDLCNALPAWRTANVSARLRYSACKHRYAAEFERVGYGHSFQGCTTLAKEEAWRMFSSSLSLSNFPANVSAAVGCIPCVGPNVFEGNDEHPDVEMFLDRAAGHPSRVFEANRSEVFFVPFNLYRNEGSAPCQDWTLPGRVEAGYMTSAERYSRLAAALLQLSQRWHKPLAAFLLLNTDYIWMGWFNEAFRLQRAGSFFLRRVYSASSWGMYGSNWDPRRYDNENGTYAGGGKTDQAGCVVIWPWQPRPKLFLLPQGFETWHRRGIVLFWRNRVLIWKNHLWDVVLKMQGSLPFKHILISAPFHDQNQFQREIWDSKFCLNLYNDDPAGHRFFDCLAALSIPVIISAGHYPYFSPFHAFLDYRSFTVNIPQDEFIRNPQILATTIQGLLTDEARLQGLYSGMLSARRALLAEDSESKIVDYGFASMVDTCGTVMSATPQIPPATPAPQTQILVIFVALSLCSLSLVATRRYCCEVHRRVNSSVMTPLPNDIELRQQGPV